MKVPQWFQDWKDNEFLHLMVDVRVMKWSLGLIGALIVAILVKVFLG